MYTVCVLIFYESNHKTILWLANNLNGYSSIIGLEIITSRDLHNNNRANANICFLNEVNAVEIREIAWRRKASERFS